MNLKNKTKDITFRADYSEEDWEEDAELMSSFLYLVPKKEHKDIVNSSIRIINNPSYTHRERVKTMFALYSPYMNETHIRSLPKKKVAKFLLKVPSGMVKSELCKIAKKLK